MDDALLDVLLSVLDDELVVLGHDELEVGDGIWFSMDFLGNAMTQFD